ncbi:MAG: hypothetical protein J5925_01820 [Clostridia bacterium]|nr:hypothetical protein [Clostridia bacterium]
MKHPVKNFIALALCALFALSLSACGQAGVPGASSATESSATESTGAESTGAESSASENVPDEEASLKIYRLHGFWLTIDTKKITGKTAAEIANALAALDETGETLPALADEEPEGGAWNIDYFHYRDSFNFSTEDLGWTEWVETDGKLYRIDFNGVSIVERPLGEGRGLAAGEVKGMISGAWNYWPYDAYRVDYDVSTGAMTSKRVDEAESGVSVTIESVRIKDGTADLYDKVGILRFRVESQTDRTAEAVLTCNQSDDNLGSEKSIRLTLAAGEPQEVEMEFLPYGRGFLPVLTVDKTMVQIFLKGTEN